MFLSLISAALFLSFLFSRLLHPLSMGLCLLVQTVMMTLVVGSSTSSFWFSYILFMIFLGGMLVLFIYVASLASNEFFLFSTKYFLVFTLSIFILTFFFFFLDPLALSWKISVPYTSLSFPLNATSSIKWIYSKMLMNFTLFIILYLLLTLLVVVKITNLFKGPLRLSN
uniref:NADH dehydrogenase subunit 6 n=1 Tax=Domecia hispida TaxID=652862 RepID=UPI0028D5A6F0|nr:NADH dehydrogenase subunit 6 [Domecia hispida]WMQ53165.1 NADH dehydrogenase subunit 6 [Domecia hispida]